MASEEDPSIITDPEALSEAHVPPRLSSRDNVLKDLRRVLEFSAARHKPIHCWLWGPSGTGKTVAARWLLRDLRSNAGIKGLYINCWEYPTYFSVLDRTVRQLRILGAERLTVSFKLERLKHHLGAQPLIMVLDEIDQPRPRERNSILYNLSQIDNVGLVCVCNSRHAYFDLEKRVRSRLNAAHVQFTTYSKEDLIPILRDRAFQGLAVDSWSDQDLSRIAGLSDGDARVAIQTLRHAAALAEQRGAHQLAPHYIQKASHSAKDLKKSYLLRHLTEHHRLLYDLIRDNPGILSGDLWRLYRAKCKEEGIEPIAVRTYSKYCNELGRIGLVQIRRAAVPGKVRKFSPAE